MNNYSMVIIIIGPVCSDYDEDCHIIYALVCRFDYLEEKFK